ncbi:MAG: carboxypeptidase regulatory-like domain-containing protein, partial [Anaerolineae bacterium]|nr:carboxypeptidase regulatory-like domain-containing protein [Anaerolineae bacterium]
PPWYEGALLPSQPVTVTVPPAPQALDLILGAPPKIVTGTVETNTGVAVTHAQVVAHRLDKGGRVETLSDPTGSYHLALSDGLWALTVKVVSTTVPSDWVFAEPPQLVHFEHTLAPEHKVENFTVITADAHVTGEVVMPGGGAPPFTVTISLHNDEGVGLYQIIEPGNTTFDVAVPNGGYKLWIRPDDTGTMGPVVEPFHVPPEETVDLGTLALLERNAVITGAITDESGTGIANVPVSAWRAGAIGGAETMTGPDGDYALSVVAGEWHVAPSPGPEHPYIFTGPAAGITLTATQTVTDVDFTLVTADATIVGFLVDENGQTLIDAGGWAQATHVLTPTLRNGAPIQAGTFSIAAPEGSFRVTANLPAGSPYMSTGERAVEIESGETVTITLQVKEKDARIIGSLWDPRNDDVVEGIDGRVLAWAGANWAQTRIDAGNGAFAMDIAAGVWHVGYHIDPRTGYVNLLHHKNVPVASEQTIPVALPIAKRDSAIEGIVLDAGGNPLGGVRVVVDGVGPVVDNIWLTTQTAADGHFHLTVPHGSYHLGAAAPFTDVIKPAQRRVMAPEGGVSGGHVLQFRTPDATISGDVAITGTTGITGPVSIWGWSDNDAFVFATVPVTHSTGAYTLDVISNTTWHLGAVFETPGQYWIAREMVSLGTGNATQDLVLTGPFPKPAPIAVTFDVMQPQQITLADGTHIFIPAGALPAEGQVTLHIAPIATLPHQRHANIYRYGYAFTAVDATGQPITEHFNQEVVIGFAYDERELRLGGIAEDRLKPAYFSTTTNLWTFPESYVVDAVANQVMMQIDHFTDFALTSQPSFSIFLPIVLVQ